jgi:hypothetical protein
MVSVAPGLSVAGGFYIPEHYCPILTFPFFDLGSPMRAMERLHHEVALLEMRLRFPQIGLRFPQKASACRETLPRSSRSISRPRVRAPLRKALGSGKQAVVSVVRCAASVMRTRPCFPPSRNGRRACLASSAVGSRPSDLGQLFVRSSDLQHCLFGLGIGQLIGHAASFVRLLPPVRRIVNRPRLVHV